MKILITGINGRIGRYAAKGLIKNGFEVIGLDIADTICSDLSGCSYVSADITNKNDLERSLKDYSFDAVIHLAALAHISSNKITLDKYRKINCEGALNVAEAACRCGAKKLLFSSTVEVYGKTKNRIVNEESPCDPVTNYGKTKFEAENKLKEYLKSVGMDYYFFRFSSVYSIENTDNLDKRVHLPKVPGAFYLKKGDLKYSLCSIKNIEDCIIAFAQDKVEPGIYIISDRELLTAKEIADMKKKNKEVKFVIRIPYGILFNTGVRILSYLLYKLGKSEKDMLITKVNKIIKPAYYDSSKINEIIQLKWNMNNTLWK